MYSLAAALASAAKDGEGKSLMDTLAAKYHLHPIIDHFTIALLCMGVVADVLGYGLAKIFGDRGSWLSSLVMPLRQAAIVLLIPGATAAVFSRMTGELEAERLWDTISPGAQQILFSSAGVDHLLSHAVLGTYLMYSFVTLAAWRILIEIWTRFRRTQPIYLAVAAVAACALLYQGKTGGELVYDHAVGTNHAALLASPAPDNSK
jgi:uncharacterized membrane protein